MQLTWHGVSYGDDYFLEASADTINWINIALLSTLTLGAVNILDSHLISKRMPSLRAFLLPVSIFHLFYALLLFYLFPLPEGISIWPVLVALAAGIFRTAGVFIVLDILKREEVSRVVPIVYAYPIFVAIMASPLLGESLYYLQWLAVIIVVAGAIMISVRQSPSSSTLWLGKPFLLLFVASLFFAVADIASKYALTYISFWSVFSIVAFCMSGSFLLISMRPHVLRQLRDMKQRNVAMALLAFNETLAPIGIVLSFWAMQRGPVSLVSPIIGSRPFFVLIFAFILSRFLPAFLEWQRGKGMLVLRLIATAMIVGGITIIYLT